MARRSQPEAAIQNAVADHLRARAALGVIWWHTPNGTQLGGRTRKGFPIQAARLKKAGVRSGVSDILAFRAGTLYALELKAPGNRPTDDQEKFIEGVNSQGGYAHWCDSLDAALGILESWGLLQGRAA